MTRQVEPIVAGTPGILTMYACGPTVYRYQHVGNLRTFLLSDLIRRTAAYEGLQVRLVLNITDVGHLQDDTGIDLAGEDKLLVQARLENKDPFAVARFYEGQFHSDLRALNIAPADHYPRASECIDLMLGLIGRLVDAGHAYVGGDGSVYFDARSFPSYGAISGNRLADLRAGHGATGESTGEGKRYHADWALWKRAGDQREMVWDSPWGAGFPGWHVECSAMSLDLLGDVVDVHTGGIDLRFPHHEDERAQSDAALGHPAVRHWVHGEHLLFEGRKMSKSTGNVVLLADVTARGLDPLAVRLSFLTQRYRTQANLSWAALQAADTRLRRWRHLVREWAEHPSKPMCAEYVARVVDAFDDDLDTPTAVKVLGELAKDSVIPPGSKFETFAALDRLFGLDLAREVGQPPAPLPAGAAALVAERESARAEKDWARADRLRAELTALGVAVADTPEGPVATVAT